LLQTFFIFLIEKKRFRYSATHTFDSFCFLFLPRRQFFDVSNIVIQATYSQSSAALFFQRNVNECQREASSTCISVHVPQFQIIIQFILSNIVAMNLWFGKYGFKRRKFECEFILKTNLYNSFIQRLYSVFNITYISTITRIDIKLNA